MTDDGFNTGVLYKGNRPAFSSQSTQEASAPEELECQFRL
jgi:hypothetical protein